MLLLLKDNRMPFFSCCLAQVGYYCTRAENKLQQLARHSLIRTNQYYLYEVMLFISDIVVSPLIRKRVEIQSPHHVPFWCSQPNFYYNACLLGINVGFFFIRCSSKVGKHYAEPGSQKVSIGDGCNFVGTIIHELMHAIGKLVYSCSSLELSKQQY